MKYLMGLLALLSAALAVAGTTSLIDDGYPPLRYQGEATMVVQYTDDLEKACGVHLPKGYKLEACELPSKKNILPNPCADEFLGQSFARLACHEKGHALGWLGNHPRP